METKQDIMNQAKDLRRQALHDYIHGGKDVNSFEERCAIREDIRKWAKDEIANLLLDNKKDDLNGQEGVQG